MPQTHPNVLAYFITFTTYGARVPGDERGSIDRRANGYGDPIDPPRPRLAAQQRDAMRWPAYQMDAADRLTVAKSISDVCAARDWPLLAFNVRTNHVHVVVEPRGGAPELVMRDFKSIATGALRRAGRVETTRKIWTRHGSTRYLFKEDAVAYAVRYVVEEQGANLAGAWYLTPGFVFADG